jgi:hypothetical protein
LEQSVPAALLPVAREETAGQQRRAARVRPLSVRAVSARAAALPAHSMAPEPHRSNLAPMPVGALAAIRAATLEALTEKMTGPPAAKKMSAAFVEKMLPHPTELEQS